MVQLQVYFERPTICGCKSVNFEAIIIFIVDIGNPVALPNNSEIDK